MARSETDLGRLIQPAFAEQKAYRERVASTYDERPAEPWDPAPWKPLNPQARVVYLQARPGERATAQFKRMNRHYRTKFLPQSVGVPTSGSRGGFSWTIQLPSGEHFFGYEILGDYEGWMNAMKAFAAEEGRLIAAIEGQGKQVVCDDGRCIPLSECNCRGLTLDD